MSLCVCVRTIMVCVVPFKVDLVITDEEITTALEEKQGNHFLDFSSLGLGDLGRNICLFELSIKLIKGKFCVIYSFLSLHVHTFI